MSDTRNGTLKDIVRAYGSEPQSTTRNGLLQEWLTAVSVIFRLALDGITNYLSHSQWTPTGVNFRLELKVRFDAGSIGSTKFILSDVDGANERLVKTSSDQLSLGYKDTGGTDRFLTLSALTVVADTDYIVLIESDGTGVTLSAGGQSSSLPDVIDPADVELIHIAANNSGTANFLGGRIWDVKYTDESFIQNGQFPKGNGVDVYGQMSPITLSGDFEIGFDARFDALSDEPIFGQVGSNNGWLRVSNGSSFGTRFNENFYSLPSPTTLAVGQTYKIVFKRVGANLSISVDGDESAPVVATSDDFVIASLLSKDNTGVPFFMSGIASNLLINDLTTGNTYQYLMNNVIDNGDGTGLVPQTGSVARFGGDISRDADTVSAPWTQIGPKQYSIDGTNVGSALVTYGSGYLDADTLYEIGITISNYVSGSFRLNNGGANSPLLTANGDYTLRFANGSSTNLNLQALVANSEFDVEVVEIRKTTDMLINNFAELDDLETVSQNSRFYPVNDGSGTNVRDALGTGSTDATINGTPDWEAM